MQTRVVPRGDLLICETFAAKMDFQFCVRVMDENWIAVFERELPTVERAWIKTLRTIRNKSAHKMMVDFDNTFTNVSLTTMVGVAKASDAKVGDAIEKLLPKSKGTLDLTVPVEPLPAVVAKKSGGVRVARSAPAVALPGWRKIISPHSDVCKGQFSNAEFAADLYSVANGTSNQPEYQDVDEFFRRTYVTGGMRDLLKQSLLRTLGRGGQPVLQLKTSFDGGKTHSMLALYHMFGGVAKKYIPDALKEIMKDIGIDEIPKVSRAVLVGSNLNPFGRTSEYLKGEKIRTIWGDMVEQLAKCSGKPELFYRIKQSDEEGRSPGAEVFREIFNECRPCVILIDELVL